MFFEEPYFSGLMDSEEKIADARSLAEPDEADANVAGFVNPCVREAEFFFEEGWEFHGVRQFGDDAGHAGVRGERVFGLFEAGEIFDEIAEFFARESILQAVRHERKGVAALLL